MGNFETPIAEVTEAEIRLDVERTWGCEYRFTERVLTGDPRGDRVGDRRLQLRHPVAGRGRRSRAPRRRR